MMTGSIRGMVLGAFALAMLLPVAAQAGTVAGPGDAEKARQLRAKAEALFDQPREWARAAKLLEASAALRAAADTEGYQCLLAAGRIRAALGDNNDAVRLLSGAGDHAMARGAVQDAALAYVFAAHAATAEKNVQVAQELIDKVRLLATSPMLTEAQREDILSRVG